jgi:hypothetical protein
LIADDLDRVYALAALGNQLYAGGTSSRYSSTGFGNIAFWDGFAWKRLGDQIEEGLSTYRFSNNDPRVEHLELTDDGLYIAGLFSRAGGELSRNIARFIPINELDLRLSIQQGGAAAQAIDSNARNAVKASDIPIDIVVRNQGVGGVVGAELDVTWSPMPHDIAWVCEPLSDGNAECPAASGSENVAPILDLPAGAGLRFSFSLTPSSDAVFQDISASIDASEVLGVVGMTADSQDTSIPISSEAVFKNDFE